MLDIWQPTADHKDIINLPATVEMSLPHVYASQIEYMSKHLNYRENVEISLHPHNDRGCGVADAELGLLAGADRIEGTLFGNGERTGNVDIITLAMNMFAHGVDPLLDFSNMPEIVEIYETVTGMKVYERQPYGGQLVFAAFSGSHQDAIAKGMKWREDHDTPLWDVPYLPVDPHDVGREYDADVIRINSQSGKGGIGYLLQQKYGLDLPPKMREDFGYVVKGVSDHQHKELMPEEIRGIFAEEYVNKHIPLKITKSRFEQNDTVHVTVNCELNGKKMTFTGEGNGRLDAVSNALREHLGLHYDNLVYTEHALQIGSTSQAIAYVGIDNAEGKTIWGAGIDNDIITASINALVSAINRGHIA